MTRNIVLYILYYSPFRILSFFGLSHRISSTIRNRSFHILESMPNETGITQQDHFS